MDDEQNRSGAARGSGVKKVIRLGHSACSESFPHRSMVIVRLLYKYLQVPHAADHDPRRFINEQVLGVLLTRLIVACSTIQSPVAVYSLQGGCSQHETVSWLVRHETARVSVSNENRRADSSQRDGNLG